LVQISQRDDRKSTQAPVFLQFAIFGFASTTILDLAIDRMLLVAGAEQSEGQLRGGSNYTVNIDACELKIKVVRR
jgi:hypothetical protein